MANVLKFCLFCGKDLVSNRTGAAFQMTAPGFAGCYYNICDMYDVAMPPQRGTACDLTEWIVDLNGIAYVYRSPNVTGNTTRGHHYYTANEPEFLNHPSIQLPLLPVVLHQIVVPPPPPPRPATPANPVQPTVRPAWAVAPQGYGQLVSKPNLKPPVPMVTAEKEYPCPQCKRRLAPEQRDAASWKCWCCEVVHPLHRLGLADPPAKKWRA